MLSRLEIENFRGFERHSLPLRQTTVIVGPNNAGKSTIVEALRLIALVAGRLRSLPFQEPPPWLAEQDAAIGVRPSLQGTGIDLRAVFHQYRQPPAVVTGIFQRGEQIRVFIGPEGQVHAVIRDAERALVMTRSRAIAASPPPIAIQPQVAPVQRDERVLVEETVRRNLQSVLAPSHFRNQLNYISDRFADFKRLAEESWPGFMVDELLIEDNELRQERLLRLLVRDGAFVGELALMGHGLQMWLQTMWFLARARNVETVIFDEPDVYMHPDLQRRLIRLVRGRHEQMIVATHSVEVMAESEPAEVLAISANQPQSRFLTEVEGVQRLVDRLGGVHNLQLARLAASRRCVFVEGEDLDFLERFQAILYPDSPLPFDNIPNMPIGGWSGWPYAVGSSMFLRNAAGQAITSYCVLDSDYHPPETIQERYREAEQANVQLRIWPKKEIENYLIVPEAVQRVIAARAPRRVTPPMTDEVTRRVDEIASSLKADVTDAFANEYHARDRGAGVQAANRAARDYVDSHWSTREGRLSRVSGKALLSALSGWSQAEFGVSFGVRTLLGELRPDEVHQDVREVVTAIEHEQPLR